MDQEAIWNSTQLMQISIDLSVYRNTIAYALGNLIIITLMSSGFILFEFSLEYIFIKDSILIFLLFWIFITVLSVFVHVFAFRFAFRNVTLGSWYIVYPIIFIVGYGLNSILNNIISVYQLWYPLIGICNVVIGYSIEKKYFMEHKLFSRPVFILGVVFLVSYPFIWLITEYIITTQNLLYVITPGFALILTSLSTSYSLAQAEKKVKNT